MHCDREYYRKSADYVRGKIACDPETAVILGSALGGLAGEIEDPVEIPCGGIPNFLVSTVELHAGKLLAGLGGQPMHEGVYQSCTGPHFETPAEIKTARILGADAVGMSTVTEALTAAHCGMPLLGLSVMTNMAAGVLEQPLGAGEVYRTAASISAPFQRYVQTIIGRLPPAGA